MKTDKKIIGYGQLSTIRRRASSSGKKIVYTTGSFDLLHLGHMLYLGFCKSKGDILVVSIGSDKTIRHNKGRGRPIYTQKVRARMLAALVDVDFVVMSTEFGKMDHLIQIGLLQPDIYIFPDSDSAIPARKKLIRGTKTKIIMARRWPPHELKNTGISTSRIIARLKE